MARGSVKAVIGAGVAIVAVPWPMFVAVFLYFTLLTLLVVSGVQLTDAFMVVAYGLPVALYGLVLMARTGRHVASMFPLHVGPHGAHAFSR